MKKLVLKMLSILLMSTLLLFSSCSSDDDKNINNPIKVDLTITVSGVLSDTSTVEYRSSNGEIVKETLTSPSTWTKTFNVQKGFNMLLKATGTLEGSISLVAKAQGNGVNSQGINEVTHGSSTDFNLEVNKDF